MIVIAGMELMASRAYNINIIYIMRNARCTKIFTKRPL
jgi:hypothetical protein